MLFKKMDRDELDMMQYEANKAETRCCEPRSTAEGTHEHSEQELKQMRKGVSLITFIIILLMIACFVEVFFSIVAGHLSF